MFVRDCMTANPITVRPDSDPLAALALLKAGCFRHLPVLDNVGKLVGIVDRADIELFLSKAGSPGVYKRNYHVEQVMTSPVEFVPPDCPLEEAAMRMVRHKIGSLPVVDSGRLVGIITETDIFKRFAAILGGGTGLLRLTVQVADVPGQLAELAGRIAGVQGNITSVVAYAASRPGRMNFTLRVEGASKEALLQTLSSFVGLEVLHFWGET